MKWFGLKIETEKHILEAKLHVTNVRHGKRDVTVMEISSKRILQPKVGGVILSDATEEDTGPEPA